MIFPIGDQPNPKGIAWVTCALLAANVLAYLSFTLPQSLEPLNLADPAVKLWLMQMWQRDPSVPLSLLVQKLSMADYLNATWGYVPARGEMTSLLTSMFLHGGLLHLAGNMLFLWIYGNNVEFHLGRLRFLLAYVLTGAAATLAFAAIVPASQASIPLVGASGAISGVLGFYFWWFPQNKVRLWVMFFPFYVDQWLIGARWVLGSFVLLENFLPLILSASTGKSSSVAYGAHLGGFLAGLALAKLTDIVRGETGIRRGEASRVGEEIESAHRSTKSRLRPQLASMSATQVLEFGGALVRQGEATAAIEAYRKWIAGHQTDARVDEVILEVGLLGYYQLSHPAFALPWLVRALESESLPTDAREKAKMALAEIHGGAAFPWSRRPQRPGRG